MELIETSLEGETYTHKVLWFACRKQLHIAKENPEGSWYFYLTAMLLAYFVFEAYINYLGDNLAPELWKDERNNFKTPPYKGTSGKLLKLCEMYDIPFPEKGRRPYQSITLLKNLRDLVAHGKLERFEIKVKHPRHKNPPFIKSKLNDFVSEKKADQATNDLKELIKDLNGKFYEAVGPDVISEHPLSGLLAASSGHMEI